MTTARHRFPYGWLVLAVAALVVVIRAGTRAAPGALLLAMAAGIAALVIRRPRPPREPSPLLSPAA